MDITTAASTIGIPAAICFFVLIRLEKSIKELTKAVQELKDTLPKLVKRH